MYIYIFAVMVDGNIGSTLLQPEALVKGNFECVNFEQLKG